MALHKTRPLADIRVIRVIYGKIASAISNQSSAINNQSSVINFATLAPWREKYHAITIYEKELSQMRKEMYNQSLNIFIAIKRRSIHVMTKQQTNIIKGVAILMMIFLHLFNRMGADYHGLCQPLLYIGERPLVNIIANACHPVAFFLILSGYGLSYVWVNKGNNLRQQGLRILKLYITYWIVMAIFAGMGCFINPAQYPGDIWSIIGNITAVKTTWNYETWFLFPYVLLSMTSMWLFRMMDRLGNKVSFIVAFFLSFSSAFIISRCSAKEIDINPVINVVLVYCDLLLNFILGALLYRYAARKKIQRLRIWQASALLVIIVGLEMLSPTQADDSFYAFFVILLILQFPYQNRLGGAFLATLGRHSMPMWMCHTFLSIYLFPNFIYGFRYPVLIFVVLTALSYAISIVVLKSSTVLENLLKLHNNHNHK